AEDYARVAFASAIRMAHEQLILHRMNIAAEFFQRICKPEGKILVQLDLHRMCGTSGTGKSSAAEAAANAMAAWMSSALRLGKSLRISSAESPSARLASTVRKVTRVPLNTGSPPQIPLSRTIRSPWIFRLPVALLMALASSFDDSSYPREPRLCRPPWPIRLPSPAACKPARQ